MTCHACDRVGDGACVRCARPLCAEHRVTRSGIARNVFGPMFDDGTARCDDCYAGRFWRAVLAFVVIIGVVGALVSLASGRWDVAVGGAGITVVLGAFAIWRINAFDRRAPEAGSS